MKVPGEKGKCLILCAHKVSVGCYINLTNSHLLNTILSDLCMLSKLIVPLAIRGRHYITIFQVRKQDQTAL